jgi:hypothetical protein
MEYAKLPKGNVLDILRHLRREFTVEYCFRISTLERLERLDRNGQGETFA